MACYDPLYAQVCGLNENGKKNLKIIGKYKGERLHDSIDYKYFKNLVALNLDEENFVRIPCGQCIGCRMDYAREWTSRLMCELQDYEENECWFVTLTYSPEALAGKEYVSDNGKVVKSFVTPAVDKDGVVIDQLWTLSKKDIQNFMKRLRRKLKDQKIRFYCCGEYGGETYRCHYHLILFGCRLPDGDLTLYKQSKLGYLYYNSRLLSDVWPFGFVVLGRVTPESCGYTARYMLKKQKGEDRNVYYDVNLEPPFTLCSRKPGLGFNYYQLHYKDSDRDFFVLPTERGNYTFPPPRYFDRLLEQDKPEQAEIKKEKKKEFVYDKRKAEDFATDLDEFERLDLLKEKFDKCGEILDNYRRLV